MISQDIRNFEVGFGLTPFAWNIAFGSDTGCRYVLHLGPFRFGLTW